MDFTLTKNSKISLHEQLLNALRETAVRLPPGSLLPSETAICRQYRVSRMTVSRAMNQLATEGCLVRKRGAGTFTLAPQPGNIYFVMPCIDAFQNPGSAPLIESYVGSLERAGELGVHLKTLIASAVNSPVAFNTELFTALPHGSRLIVYGNWFRNLFPLFEKCGHEVAFIDPQNEQEILYRDLIRNFHHIVIDRREGVATMIDRFASIGCRRIAFIHNFAHYCNPCNEGCRIGLKRNGLEFIPEIHMNSSDCNDQLAIFFELKSYCNFDALLVGNADILELYNIALANRLLPGRDLPLGVLGVPRAAPCDLFALEYPNVEAGRCAVEILTGRESAQRLSCRILDTAEINRINLQRKKRSPVA